MKLFREKGRAEGVLKALANLISKWLLSPKDEAPKANITKTEFTIPMAEFGY